MSEQYVKIRLHGRRAGIIRVTSRKRGMVSGVLVNKFGDEVGGASGIRNVVVGLEADVIAPMQWNLKYAELEPQVIR